jgi:hypothetical protein
VGLDYKLRGSQARFLWWFESAVRSANLNFTEQSYKQFVQGTNLTQKCKIRTPTTNVIKELKVPRKRSNFYFTKLPGNSDQRSELP